MRTHTRVESERKETAKSPGNCCRKQRQKINRNISETPSLPFLANSSRVLMRFNYLCVRSCSSLGHVDNHLYVHVLTSCSEKPHSLSVSIALAAVPMEGRYYFFDVAPIFSGFLKIFRHMRFFRWPTLFMRLIVMLHLMGSWWKIRAWGSNDFTIARLTRRPVKSLVKILIRVLRRIQEGMGFHTAWDSLHFLTQLSVRRIERAVPFF